MIFIFEPQIDYNKTIPEDFFTLYSLAEAGYIFNFLFDLAVRDEKQFEEIDRIFIIKDQFNLNNSLKKSFKILGNTFNTYSPFSEMYKDEKHYADILDFLPDRDKNDGLHSSEIITLIKNCQFCEVSWCDDRIKEHLKDNSELFLFYLPYNKQYLGNLSQIFFQKEDSLILYSNSDSMRTKEFQGIKRLETKKYFDTLKLLEDARKIELSVIESPTSELRNYRPDELIRNFSDDFYPELCRSITHRHISISGDDDYLMKRSVNHILRSYIPAYYDLKAGIPELGDDSDALVFLNADKLLDFNEARKLFNQLKGIPSEDYIILQRIKELFCRQYFDNYLRLNLPSEDKIKSILTKIFLSLINEISAFRDSYFRLERISKTNCLNELLSELTSLEEMFSMILRLQHLTVRDLLCNADLWYYIRTSSGNNASKKKSVSGKLIKLKHTGKGWKLEGLINKRELEFPDLKGLLLLAIIIEYKRHISYGEITDILSEYLGNNVNEIKGNKSERNTRKNDTDKFDQYEKLRKNYFANFNYLRKSTISKNDNNTTKNKINKFKTDRELLGIFIREHIECVDNGYVFNENNKLQCIIIDSKLEKIIKEGKRRNV